jgi:hypothetical protein
VSLLDLLEDFGGNAAGGAMLLQALEHLALGGEEGLEKLAHFLRGRLLLTSRL